MITRRIPALVLALCPLWAMNTSFADDKVTTDPVAVIDNKLESKHAEIEALNTEYETEVSKLQQLKNDLTMLKRAGTELDGKRNRSKAALDKQYSRLLEDPDIDLLTFQKAYQEAWGAVKDNQTQQLGTQQAITEAEMRLSQAKQKQARLTSEFSYLKEQKVEARVKRLEAELRESSLVEASFKTTCATTMTLGECSSQGKRLTQQKAVSSFRDGLLDKLTESALVKQNAKDVELNVFIQESQIIRAGFEGNADYFTQMQAQISTKPEPVAACKLLNVATRYCLSGQAQVKSEKQKDWANVVVRSDQFNDSVVINGVDYGSTPVEVVLPAGRHQVTVSKDGFETYNRTITVSGNDTVWVKLRRSKDT